MFFIVFCFFFIKTNGIFMFFFFSSRRRHTRFKCDWSSDVCSSDLLAFLDAVVESNLREDAVQVLDMHSGSETPTATLADRRLASLSRRLIKLHADLSGTLKNMEKLSERKIEQRADHGDRVQNREKAVELSAQPLLRNRECKSGHRNRE